MSSGKVQAVMRRSVSLVNVAVRRAVLDALGHAFDIDKSLSEFVSPVRFRALQASLNFIIAGDFAFQFLNSSVFYEPTEMDVYAHTHDIDRVARFLLADGYTLMLGRVDRIVYDEVGVSAFIQHEILRHASSVKDRACCGVWHFARVDVVEQARTIKSITLMAATNEPLMCVLNLPSRMLFVTPVEELSHELPAHLMNFITEDRAYSLYPDVAFRHSRAIPLAGSRGFYSTGAFARAIVRSTPARANAWMDTHAVVRACKTLQPTMRRIGDALCWSVPLRRVRVLGDGSATETRRLQWILWRQCLAKSGDASAGGVSWIILSGGLARA